MIFSAGSSVILNIFTVFCHMSWMLFFPDEQEKEKRADITQKPQGSVYKRKMSTLIQNLHVQTTYLWKNTDAQYPVHAIWMESVKQSLVISKICNRLKSLNEWTHKNTFFHPHCPSRPSHNSIDETSVALKNLEMFELLPFAHNPDSFNMAVSNDFVMRNKHLPFT